jgi:hypothetical protein
MGLFNIFGNDEVGEATETWMPIPQWELDQADQEIREQVGTCNICGGPADGTACDHRADGRPYWSSHPDPIWNEE